MPFNPSKLLRLLKYAAYLAAFLFATLLLALRYWLLPGIDHYRAGIADSISRAAGQRVEIAQLEAGWEGLRPHLTLKGVQVYDTRGRRALFLQSLENTVSWSSLLAGEIRLHALEIEHINLVVRRDPSGLIFVAGLPLNQPQQESGFADWLLRQQTIRVRDSILLWQDEARGAAPLVLTGVNLRLENSGQRHALGLTAIPPATLATPLDVRADLRGDKLSDLRSWRGQLYVRLERTHIGGWRPWVDLPYKLQGGRGGVQAWIDMGDGMLQGVTADVLLGGANLQLAEDLPPLDVRQLAGRLGWHRYTATSFPFGLRGERRVGQEVKLEQVRVGLGDGTRIGPVDFQAKWLPASQTHPEEGEVTVDRLQLEPLLALSRYLPLPAAQSEKLAQYDPHGSFREFSASWKGSWQAPQSYAVKGRFANLALKASESAPGFSGFTGNIDANQKGGTLFVDSRQAILALPKVFRAPLGLDALTAQVSWKRLQEGWEIRLANASLSNADLAGTAYGSYRTVKGTPGYIDLTANFNRADARQVSKYIPLVVGQGTRDWLDTAFLAGGSNDVRLRLKGNLADFPFVDNQHGLFQVMAKISGGVLDYAKGWPKIDNIVGDLLFEGKRMVVSTQQGSIFGAQLPRVRAVIPDLLTYDEMLEIDGEAQGPTGEFLRFIENSPVSDMINHFTDGMQASGNGKLDLKLQLPLRRTHESKLKGVYQFLNNRIIAGEDIPPVENARGKLEFSEAGVTVNNAAAQILGGPAVINVATQQDGMVRVSASGKLTALGLRKANYVPYAQFLRGGTDWRGTLTLRKKLADFVVDSNLLGLSLDFPAPFNKKPNETIPLRIDKKILSPQQDMVSIAYGQIASAKIMRRAEGQTMRVERGSISLGGVASLPPQNGLWLNGSLSYLDLDQWRTVLAQGNGGTKPGLSGAMLSVATLDAFGRRFADLRLNAWMQQDGWKASLNGREMNGEVSWSPVGEGRSKLTGRFRTFVIPAAAPARPGGASNGGDDGGSLPALDISVENFQIRQRKLGKLELEASQVDQGWRIEKLRLTNPDSTLLVDGLWQWSGKPFTRANIKWEVSDLGKLLARFDQPDSIKRGSAKLEGNVSWAGAPSDLDYATLNGNFSLQASNGQFMKVDPGIGKLLGILSLQALPRRITLDFRDVFSEGFAFDDISANVRIQKGVASSDDFKMNGPAAKVTMKGETDLARETQRLTVRVTPALGEGVSVASALLGGPAAGLTALLVQKVLKDPLGQIASYEYLVTGSWSDPKVQKVSKPAPASGSFE